MLFSRDISQQCLTLAKQYPVVTIMGPRQSGKTTLVKHLFKDYAYINLEAPDIRELVAHDPRSVLNKYPNGLIIDEIQNVPSVLSYIQTLVDEKQQEGLYILTGSHQVSLHEAISQSLAGRTAILQLLPMSLSELHAANVTLSLDELLLSGGYPRVHAKSLSPTQVYRDYVQTYLERDVRKIINLKDLLLFQRFIKLCAARTGHVLNMNSLSNEVGVTSHTIKHWLSILQASYLVQLISPYFENFGKQIIKSPKLYFTDVGLACYLLDIETVSQMNRDPLRGHLFETLVAMDLIKTRINQGREPNLYFYRDSQKHEVDLIYKTGAELVPIEIKSAQTISRSFFKGIDYFNTLLPQGRILQNYIVYAGTEEFSLENANVIQYSNAHQIVE